MNVPLTDSPSLVVVPEVDLDRAVILDPSIIGNWHDTFAADDATLDYLLPPGDYRQWGPLWLDNVPGNTNNRPKTIRYYNPNGDDALHPARREQMALVDSVRFEHAFTRNWLATGLTVRRPTINPGIFRGATNVTIDSCLIEHTGQYGLRIRDASYSTVQRCVIRDSINTDENGSHYDTTGIHVGIIGDSVLGIRILDNEIYNVGDGIQLGDDLLSNDVFVIEVVIEGNDIYLEPSRYIGVTNTTWDENAIDVKGGSDALDSTVIRHNRMWGMRRNATPTAFGEILTVHKSGRNIRIEDNIMGDAPRGIADFNWLTGIGTDVNKPRKILARNNQFYDIHDYAADDHGAITSPVTAGTSFIGNYFARSDYLVDDTPLSGYRGDGPIYTDNVLVEIRGAQRRERPSLLLDPCDGNTVATAPNGYDTYERRRWTGPEVAMGAVPTTNG
jgi:Right handed beta helix region